MSPKYIPAPYNHQHQEPTTTTIIRTSQLLRLLCKSAAQSCVASMRRFSAANLFQALIQQHLAAASLFVISHKQRPATACTLHISGHSISGINPMKVGRDYSFIVIIHLFPSSSHASISAVLMLLVVISLPLNPLNPLSRFSHSSILASFPI